jgi:hypothetical protein
MFWQIETNAIPTEEDSNNYSSIETPSLGINVENYGRVVVIPDVAFATYVVGYVAITLICLL